MIPTRHFIARTRVPDTEPLPRKFEPTVKKAGDVVIGARFGMRRCG
jgi:hypothetical protein